MPRPAIVRRSGAKALKSNPALSRKIGDVKKKLQAGELDGPWAWRYPARAVSGLLRCLSVVSRALVASWACGCERRASAAFVRVPAFLAAGERFSVTVAYELPGGLTARLSLELKDTRNNVLQLRRGEVSGMGVFQAAFTAPRQFRFKPGSPALKIGIVPIVLSRIGPSPTEEQERE